MATIKLIGDAPNQVSRNRDLGDLAYQDAENIAGDVGVGGALTVVGETFVSKITASTGILFGTDTAAANTLDDYEEGTWTATLTGSTAAPTTPITAVAIYTKIGRIVTVQIVFNNVNTTGATGNIRITGFPFAFPNLSQEPNGVCAMSAQGSNAGALNGILNQTYAEIWNLTNLGAIPITATTSVYIRGTMIYQV